MIDQPTYLALRDRYRSSGEIDQQLYELLLNLTRVVIFNGHLPPAYSPTGSWSPEAAEDAAHGWIERRLLRTNALLAAFDLGQHHRPFLNSLEQNFRHHLQNERERAELPNLLRRTGALLRDDARFRDWLPQRRPFDTWWGLVSWTNPVAFQGGDDILVAHAWALGEITLFRYAQNVDRASPVLSTETLGEFLTGLFTGVAALLTLAHLAAVYEGRFDLGATEMVELEPETADELAAPEAPPDEEVSAAAVNVAAELSARQFEVLLRRSQEETLEVIAAALGVSRGTVDNDLRNCAPAIDRYCAGGITREQILEKLLDSLS